MKKIISLLMMLLLFATANANPGNGELKEKFITLENGITLAYVETGNAGGTPLVLLHGLSDSWFSFSKIMPMLPQSFRIIAISLRGHGHSSKTAGSYKPTDMASDIASFIKLKKLGRVIIAGHSMGGVVAQQFALDHPRLSKGLIIISSGPFLAENREMAAFNDEVQGMKDSISYAFMEEFQKGTIVKPVAGLFVNQVIAEGMKCPLPVFKSALQGLIDTDLRQQLTTLKLPVLILYGAKDLIFLGEGQKKMAESLKQVKFITYEDAGHALHWEEPEKVSFHIEQFLFTHF